MLEDSIKKEYQLEKLEDLEILQSLEDEKIVSLQEDIKEIEDLIAKREGLNKEIVRDIEKIKSEINSFIMQLGNETNLGEQLKLRQKQIDIDELKIKAKLEEWRDIAELKKELREHKRLFRERESRMKMLDKILS